MPSKTTEQVRDQVLALARAGQSYTQIQNATKTAERPKGLARPTIWSILKEAGMVKPGQQVRGRPAAPPASEPPATAPKPSASPNGNGLDEFQPPAPPKPKATAPPETTEAEYLDCSECGSTHALKNGEKLERCLACGAYFD